MFEGPYKPAKQEVHIDLNVDKNRPPFTLNLRDSRLDDFEQCKFHANL